MRSETLRRVRLVIQRDIERIAQSERVRKVARDFLRYKPAGFPHIKSGVLSRQRRSELVDEYRQGLDDYGALPDVSNEERLVATLTDDERALFRALQQQAYAATSQPKYVTLQWDRADGAVRSREAALLYEPDTGRYLFLAHILHADSRYCRPLTVRGNLLDVNNPDTSLKAREKSTIANLYELEFSGHQRQILDRARHEAGLWKERGKTSGAVRSAKLQAHFDEEHNEWWFVVMLAVGFKPKRFIKPQRVIGVHIDPRRGWFISIFELNGALVEHFQLDELRIAHLLENKQPDEQAKLNPAQRTSKEVAHRHADAIATLCHKHSAVCAVENISYRSLEPGPQQLKPQQVNSRTIFRHLEYKLPLLELAPPLDVKGVAPRRDCGKCSHRHGSTAVKGGVFHCQQCGHSELSECNAVREVARRALWMLATKKTPRPKKTDTARTVDHKTAAG